MPVKVGDPQNWEVVHPTTEWRTMKTKLPADKFGVATELYYINVSKS
jgi:hypothetical protein